MCIKIACTLTHQFIVLGMAEEERKVKSKPGPSSLVFRHDQLVIVYDDVSPVANDLCVLIPEKPASDEDRKWFTSLVDDFPRVIRAMNRYRYRDPSGAERDVDLLPVPLSQWLAVNRDQPPSVYNTPLFVVFVQFFYWRQEGVRDQFPSFSDMISSQSATKIILEQTSRVFTANVHNIRPLGYDTRDDYVHLGVVCLSRWGVPYALDSNINPRHNALSSKLQNAPAPGEDPYDFPHTLTMTCLHLSTTRALEDAAYRNTIVGDFLLYRLVRYTIFKPLASAPRMWNNEAAALSSAISTGLCNRNSGNPWDRFLTRGVYDPRLFRYIWHFLTGDTLPAPEPERDEKRKRRGEEEEED